MDKGIIDCNQENGDLMNNIKSSCRQVLSEVFESGKASSPSCITSEVVGSVGAQLELLRHELFLTKKQVKERNRQILKLERIINNQKEELQHNCEGSSCLMKLTKLLYGAVDVQNKQLENMRNIKRRLFALEDSPFVTHKPINIQRSNMYNSSHSSHITEQGNSRILNQCNHMCNFECKTENRTTQYPNVRSQPKSLCAENKENETLKAPTDYSSEVSQGFEAKNLSKENLDELEKQRMINCQLNDNLMKLQEDVKTLKLKIEKLEEQEVAASRSSSLFQKEKQSLLEQLSNLTRQNGKLQGHISQIDRERDKAVRELDSSDEIISKMGIEVQRANFEARNLECQLSVSAARCRWNTRKRRGRTSSSTKRRTPMRQPNGCDRCRFRNPRHQRASLTRHWRTSSRQVEGRTWPTWQPRHPPRRDPTNRPQDPRGPQNTQWPQDPRGAGTDHLGISGLSGTIHSRLGHARCPKQRWPPTAPLECGRCPPHRDGTTSGGTHGEGTPIHG
uniref:Caspase recruitment domain-containing protein 14 n=1 Tax=Lygus hesperus TaxID=30085 RepID=A0A0A9YS21_LYGHE